MDSVIFISVIVPNFNHSQFLFQRIESILNQTYARFEIIILDDCSSDNSRDIIEKYRYNPHVSHILYNETNSGSTFKQWEKGIELAKGDYIWIAESDDFCEPNMLEELINQVKSHPSCSLAYALSQQVDREGIQIGNKVRTYRDKFVNGRVFIQRYMSCENPVYNASSAIFRKTSALVIDQQYMNYKGAGDRLFWIEIAEQGDVAIVNKPLNYFRQHGNKVTPQKTLDGTNMRENFMIYQYLCDHNLLSSFRKYLVRGYSLYLIDITKFKSEDIKNELYKIWGGNAHTKRFQKIMGRLLVSLHYHGLHLYL